MAATDERKPVTVLFADLAGSTELATRQDPEHLRALLTAFFDEMRQQIEAFGGTVEKYAGDAVMAVFGVPQVHEDDAERAVRAAFAMQESLTQLNPMFDQEYGVRLVLRIGVATGEAVAASRAVNDFMVTGQVPNLAARLQAAGAGITVSETTRRLLGPRLEAEAVGALTLKGFPEPVTAYRAHALRAAERPEAGVAGLSSPVIGREREQAALAACMEDLRRGRGQVIVIVGEAGLGKTRLKIEQRERHPEGVRWLEGRCQSYTQSTSYAPVVQILRAALRLGAADAPAIARARLRAALRDLGGAVAEQTEGALAHLLGVDLGPGHGRSTPGDPRALQSQLVLATRALLQRLAERGPIVVAVEDLHWADTASVDLLTLLLELSDFQPIMFLVMTRPETEGDTWTFRVHAERNFGHRLTELRLGPLAAEASRRLADTLLRVSDVPAAIRERILQRSEGNPFFLEEILRSLIEEGVLRREGDRWTAETPPERWAIPTTLLGVISARIDRLPAPAKSLLQRAAVIGRFFGYRALRELTDEPAELDRALALLLRAELIRESAALPERQYLFKHALTQEAAESSLLAEQRREFHGRIARYLETTVGEAAAEHVAVLAHHWYHAGQWEHALEHTLAAADRARSLHDRPAAIAHYWRALEILDQLPPTERRLQQHADAALALVRLPGFARDAAMIRRAMDHLDRAIESAARRADTGRLVRMRSQKGFIVADEALLKETLSLAEASGDPLALAWTVERYGQYLGQRGRFDESLVQTRRAIAIYAAQEARYQQAFNVTAGGRCYSARAGRLDDSLRYAVEFRQMANELGEPPLLAWRAMEAEPHFYRGAWDAAIQVAEENLPIAWRIGEINVILFASAWLGLACLKAGRLSDARRVVDRAVECGEISRDSTRYALTYLTTAAALSSLAEGALDAALAQARRALDYAEGGRFPLERGAAYRVLGQAYAATQDRAGADAAFRTSLEILERIHARPEIGQTLLAYGQFRTGDDPADGREWITRACGLFEEIGADGWLAEARGVLAALPR